MLTAVIDIGNTNIKAGLFRFSESGLKSVETFVRPKSDTIHALMDAIHDRSEPVRLMGICCSRQERESRAMEWESATDTPVHFVEHADSILPTRYCPSDSLGLDRLCACEGAVFHGLAPCIILDCGTATTVTFVNQVREIEGGLIMPGLLTGINALIREVGSLPAPALSANFDPVDPDWIKNNTLDAFSAGSQLSISASADYIIRRIRADHGQHIHAVLTGGNADFVKPELPHRRIPNLVLMGVVILALRKKGLLERHEKMD